MAASAEYELEKRVEKLDLFPVELEKGEHALLHMHKHGRLHSHTCYVTPLTHSVSVRVLFTDLHCLLASPLSPLWD